VILNQRVCVVLPAYRAARTLERTVADLDRSLIDDIILVDDHSDDDTVAVARRLGLQTIVHPQNRGYGGNQKTCYAAALDAGADIVVMVHPDFQYDPRLAAPMARRIAEGSADVMLGSRTLSGRALQDGMPIHRYVANRWLTAIENIVTGAGLSEYHTGLRAFSRRVLETVPWQRNHDDFLFDAEMLAQCLHFGFRVGELSCPTRYAADSSTVNIASSIKYALGVLGVTAAFGVARLGLARPSLFNLDR
jgi:glycosyltransferase involved in cell wall biosynthesis